MASIWVWELGYLLVTEGVVELSEGTMVLGEDTLARCYSHRTLLA